MPAVIQQKLRENCEKALKLHLPDKKSRCKHIGAMYKVYEIHRPNVNGHEIYFGRNKCSICGYEEDWQYDI